MTTTTFSNALLPLAGTDIAPAKDAPVKRSFFTRFFEAMHKSREAQARREIARVEAMLGFTIAEREGLSRGELPFRS